MRSVDAAQEDHMCAHAGPRRVGNVQREHGSPQGIPGNHPHPKSPESRKESNWKYRISSYGLTQEQFDRLLDAQQHTCGMCHEPFTVPGLVIAHRLTILSGRSRGSPFAAR